MADYFDRLLARHTPVSAADGAGDSGTRTRVRPRLSGPYERAEALRHGPPGPDEPAALVPVAPRTDPVAPRSVRQDREVRTERHTVVRTEHIPRADDDARPFRPVAVEPATLPRPSVTAPPMVRPDREEGARAARRGLSSVPDDPASAPVVAAVTARASAAPVRAAALPVPRGSDSAAAARGAALGSVGRRAPRPAERVVHVQIGRLEVSAGPPPGANGTPAGRPAQRPGRPAPVLTLDDYLSRGGKRD
ncbi:hypothetical protein [Streptomyces atroolivaceus]|uniref:hypothetical protein n=1 Tax=Streptomyces atroolivaceus TaxID=66869 RepID=UPI00379A06AF